MRKTALAVLVGSLAVGVGTATAGHDGRAIDTKADYTPFEEFTPVPSSSPCVGALDQPFVLPPEYRQRVVEQEGPEVPVDQWDMNTQNESGKHAGRYMYRTHELFAGQSALSVTDLTTGVSRVIAQRPDWEGFDGLVWTPWKTVLAAEESTATRLKDPTVPQANAGLVYEFFLDLDDPTRLDPSREPMGAPGDGTTDSVRDGIRARPAVGSKSHEGIRFDKSGFLYGIAESRGQTTAGASGGVFRFIPDRKGDLSSGQLQALQTLDRRYGSGRWVDLDRAAVQVDADAEAERKGANEYQRPEDVETGTSTGKDVLNGGNTLYVAVDEGPEEGIMAVDLSSKEQPFAYPYVGPLAGNTSPDFSKPDNVALDRKGNLAITEDPSVNTIGADIWIAAPPQARGTSREPARTVQRFATLKDCAAEPSGIYFAMKGTKKIVKNGPFEGIVTDETLFAHRMHAGQGTALDQLVAINPLARDKNGERDDEDEDEDEDG